MMVDAELLERAAGWLHEADGLLITAGAGMGVDSGLPDFRGNQGLWAAYPALGDARIGFEGIANPDAFRTNPALAWGFYGHRLALYRHVEPHPGFAVLRRWAGRMKNGAFVYTSNVDGQFQKAEFSESAIAECHGSIHYLQCMEPCSANIWPADGLVPDVDTRACRLLNGFPRCPRCGGLARPNILMFWDSGWLADRTDSQLVRLDGWLRGVKQLVVVELGAGTSLPTVRRFSERHGPRVIRINVREPHIDAADVIGLRGTALETLEALDRVLRGA
ncbi:Sir2 family NAD-dependent protein deacetylase [Burkholderia sp. Bp8991]|uniref:SIR2 family NAD-dependent protein deacylase n=1 Tax=Burkholderia sp. Bp8991 TaxID=2184553 RepID=UPI000F594C9F|nr:Sir2 family NAD-dependent protein deacetylase [Burkholderia sp. Bp8991]RQR95181.1 NAD-dependent deacetylase [Burkholderia sp. Bp8991]